MNSHAYEFELKDLMRLLVPPLVPVAVFAGLMHLGAWLRVLPEPRPTLDTDRTILVHQAEAAGKKSSAEILLMGDSSCLMDVSAIATGEQLGKPVLNLGTLSLLDLHAYGSMLRHFSAANPGAPRTVVLLMHPEALRRPGPEKTYTDFLNQSLEGKSPERLSESGNGFYAILGVDILKNRILSRLVPTPLPGVFGQKYGFSRDLERYLEREGGSLVDPEPRKFQGNAEYFLSAQLEKASRAFKAAVPRGCRIFCGITPVPAGFARTNYAAQHEVMLKQWSEWLQAEPLTLPAMMPDELFVKTTHLNEAGIRVYTQALGECLKGRLR